MSKKLLLVSFMMTLMATVSVSAAPMAMAMEMGVAEQVEPERNITITVNNSTVEITGATGMTLEVVSLTGRQVATYRIDSPAQLIDLNVPKGCYILKVGKMVRKVTVK